MTFFDILGFNKYYDLKLNEQKNNKIRKIYPRRLFEILFKKMKKSKIKGKKNLKKMIHRRNRAVHFGSLDRFRPCCFVKCEEEDKEFKDEKLDGMKEKEFGKEEEKQMIEEELSVEETKIDLNEENQDILVQIFELKKLEKDKIFEYT